MAVAELVAGRIEVDVPLREKTLITQVPGARYHGASQRWRVGLSWAACKQLRGVLGDKLTVGPELTAWAWERSKQVGALRQLREAALNPEQGYGRTDPRLKPFQQTGWGFLTGAGSAILADDLGLGKTPQSLCAVEHWPLLVVTKKACRLQWAREVETWTGRPALTLEGTPLKRRKQIELFTETSAAGEPGALIVNWDQLISHSRLAPYGSIALTDKERAPKELNSVEWGTVIADEAHKAKCPKTKWTRALWALGDPAQARYALTGTPLEGSLLDFWALLRFVAPQEWPTKSGYIDRYCVSSYNVFGALEIDRLRADTEDEFRELVNLRFLRRPKDLVAPWLPKRVPIVRTVQLNTTQAKTYKTLADSFVAALDSGGEVVAFTALSKSARLVQLSKAALEEYTDPSKVDKDTGELVPQYRMIEPSPTLDELEEVLEELAGASCVVFSKSRQLLRLAEVRLAAKGVSYGVIAGDVKSAAVDMARDEYNAGRLSVLLVSLGSGAEGLNLTRGSTEIFIDRSWSFLENTQGEGRLHGINRGDADAETCTIIDIITEGTVDEGRFKLYAEKGELMEHLVRDREVIKRMVRGEV